MRGPASSSRRTSSGRHATSRIGAIEVVCDTSVVLKWFHEQGERDVDSARAILAAHRSDRIQALVLDLTRYELGNALLRGRIGASAEQVATVLSALAEICVEVAPDSGEMSRAAALARTHGLSFYDASYAAVAQAREAMLVTADGALLREGLGIAPGALAVRLAGDEPGD